MMNGPERQLLRSGIGPLMKKKMTVRSDDWCPTVVVCRHRHTGTGPTHLDHWWLWCAGDDMEGGGGGGVGWLGECGKHARRVLYPRRWGHHPMLQNASCLLFHVGDIVKRESTPHPHASVKSSLLSTANHHHLQHCSVDAVSVLAQWKLSS